MKAGDAVYIQLEGRWWCFRIARLHEEIGGTATLENGVGELICRQSELVTPEAYKAMVREKQREAARPKYADVIRMWENGCRSGKAMQEASGHGHPLGWTAAIRAAKHWGLISEYPEQPYPSNEPSPADQPNVQ